MLWAGTGTGECIMHMKDLTKIEGQGFVCVSLLFLLVLEGFILKWCYIECSGSHVAQRPSVISAMMPLKSSLIPVLLLLLTPPFIPPSPPPRVNSNNPAHRYFLTTDPVTGRLYVSDTNSRRIYRPKMLSGVRDLIGKSSALFLLLV